MNGCERAGTAGQGRAVVVHAGARDGYQLAYALAEDDLLHTLVTNVYWQRWVTRHYAVRLPRRAVTVSRKALLAYAAMRAVPGLNIHYLSDSFLSKKARDLAHRAGVSLFAYSYYATDAFKPGPRRPQARFLFQLHPHPRSVKQILSDELERTPFARMSLLAEAELSLSQSRFDEFAEEAHLANGWVVASSYTASTLVEHGINPGQIHVTSYGVDAEKYPARSCKANVETRPFTIIFLGSFGQRKGLAYLLAAVRSLRSKHIRVVLRGRGAIDEGILKHFSDLDFDIKVGAPLPEIVASLHSSDLFVMPSLAEGFCQAILEAMACGLPVVATRHTCAPDVMVDGEHGFLVPVQDSQAIAERIEWCIGHRDKLFEMGQSAGQRAREYTWDRFRSRVRSAFRKMQQGSITNPDAARTP